VFQGRRESIPAQTVKPEILAFNGEQWQNPRGRKDRLFRAHFLRNAPTVFFAPKDPDDSSCFGSTLETIR
jgi:hypothetical protein